MGTARQKANTRLPTKAGNRAKPIAAISLRLLMIVHHHIQAHPGMHTALPVAKTSRQQRASRYRARLCQPSLDKQVGVGFGLRRQGASASTWAHSGAGSGLPVRGFNGAKNPPAYFFTLVNV